MGQDDLYLGSSREEIERYYSRLQELAMPQVQRAEEMIETIKEWKSRSVDSDGQQNWDKVIDAFLAWYYVVKPLNDAVAFRSRIIFLNQPFSSISDFYHGGHYANLAPTDIYEYLLLVPEANRSLIFRGLKCSYAQQNEFSDYLREQDKDGFIALFNSFEDTGLLSDICWELFSLDSERLGKEGLGDGMEAAIHHGPSQEEQGYDLKKLLKASEHFYQTYKSTRQNSIDEDFFYPHTPREIAVFEEVINRPEGACFRSRFDDEFGKERESGEMSEEKIVERFTGGHFSFEDSPKPTEVKAPKAERAQKRGEKRKTPGREPDKWFKGAWTEEEFGQIIKKNVWPYLREELRGYNYGIDKNKAKDTFEDAVKASAAAIIVYCSDMIGLTTVSPIKGCTPSMKRTFSFLPAPRTTVTMYLKRLNNWYEKLKDASITQIKENSKATVTFEKWKQEDRIRASFIIENNFRLKKLLNNNLPYLLAVVFDVNTDIKYSEINEAYDKALYMATQYREGILKKKTSEKRKDNTSLSDGAGKDIMEK